MKNNIKTIVFDLGGVLIDWNPRYLFKKIFKDENKMEIFLKDICNQEWNEKQDAGRSFKKGVQELSLKHPDYAEHIQTYNERWEEMLSGPIEKTVQILKQLHQQKKYRLLSLTNWSAEKFPVALDRFEFLKLFEGILVSGDENLKKPDPKIFQLLCERYNLVASQCLFIDDVLKNIESANKMGFKTFHFKKASEFKSFLIDNKLI